MPLLSWEEKCTSTKFDYSLPDWQGFQEMILHAKVVLGDIWLQLFLDSKVLKESPSGPSDVMESRKEMVTICPRYSWLRTSHYIFYFPPRSKNFLGTICILITRSASQLSHFTNQTHFKVTHYHMTPSLPVKPESISNCFSDFISGGSNMFVADCGVTNRGRSAIIGKFLYLNLCIIVILLWKRKSQDDHQLLE